MTKAGEIAMSVERRPTNPETRVRIPLQEEKNIALKYLERFLICNSKKKHTKNVSLKND